MDSRSSATPAVLAGTAVFSLAGPSRARSILYAACLLSCSAAREGGARAGQGRTEVGAVEALGAPGRALKGRSITLECKWTKGRRHGGAGGRKSPREDQTSERERGAEALAQPLPARCPARSLLGMLFDQQQRGSKAEVGKSEQEGRMRGDVHAAAE